MPIAQTEKGFNPYGTIREGRPNEVTPFDIRCEGGVEYLSILIPEEFEEAFYNVVSGKPTGWEMLDVPRRASREAAGWARWLVLDRLLYRGCDWDRCTMGFRVREDKKIEVRLKFSPPWWYNQSQCQIPKV